MNNEGIPGPKGRLWQDTTIRGHATRRTGVLRNDLYRSQLVWNKQHYVKDPKIGRRLARPNSQDQWIIEDVPHLRDAAPPPAPILHPDLAELYRRKVENLHEALNAPESRVEASEILREIIHRIDGRILGHGRFEIDLVGDI